MPYSRRRPTVVRNIAPSRVPVTVSNMRAVANMGAVAVDVYFAGWNSLIIVS
jgi:hypothetical protein